MKEGVALAQFARTGLGAEVAVGAEKWFLLELLSSPLPGLDL